MSMCLRVCAILCVCLAAAMAAAAEGTLTTMAKNGNVRYGPSTDADIIVTLPVGSEVSVLGQVPGRDGWYVIRFPRQGVAWMHQRNLQLLPDGRSFEVTSEVANVRADSRVGGELVDQVVRGEMVEWVDVDPGEGFIGRSVGNWVGVYPPDAVAYAYHSVLDLDGVNTAVAARPGPAATAGGPAAPAGPTPQQQLVDERWRNAADAYRRYRAMLQEDPESALDLDWRALDQELALVVERHHDTRTRLTAQQVRVAIAKLADYIRRVRSERGLSPAIATLPDLGEDGGPAPAATQAAPLPEPVATPTPTPAAQPTQLPETPVSTPDLQPPAVVEAPAPVVEEPAAALGPETLVGWVATQDVQGAPSSNVLIGTDGEVAAVLEVPAGSSIVLSEFFWRQVQVTGAQRMLTVTVAGIERTLPLVTVDSVLMNRM